MPGLPGLGLSLAPDAQIMCSQLKQLRLRGGSSPLIRHLLPKTRGGAGRGSHSHSGMEEQYKGGAQVRATKCRPVHRTQDRRGYTPEEGDAEKRMKSQKSHSGWLTQCCAISPGPYLATLGSYSHRQLSRQDHQNPRDL